MNRSSCFHRSDFHLPSLLCSGADAAASVRGSKAYPGLSGTVYFYQTQRGVLVRAEIYGLPEPDQPCEEPVFGFHIHEGGRCGGNADDPFSDAMSHYNPHGCGHPFHAGDMPPLFGCGGSALLLFLTDRFCVEEVIGKTVIIHDHPDDFTSQPSGNSGTKIACGVIQKTGSPCIGM